MLGTPEIRKRDPYFRELPTWALKGLGVRVWPCIGDQSHKPRPKTEACKKPRRFGPRFWGLGFRVPGPAGSS